jgi:putative membrane protein
MGIYLFCYPFAVVGIAFDVRADFSMSWAGSFLLAIQGALATVWFALTYGWRRGIFLTVAIGVGAGIVETLGVLSGWPFGPYRYTLVLAPSLPGGVPLPVICAWLYVVAASVAITRALVPRSPRIWRVMMAALLSTALDGILEPVAVHIVAYWRWLVNGPYYGVPISNFVGWLLLSTLFYWLVFSQPDAGQPGDRGGESMYFLTTMMFAFIAATHHQFGAAVLGVVLVVVLGTFLLASRGKAAYDPPIGE